jgi:hypothetical protein
LLGVSAEEVPTITMGTKKERKNKNVPSAFCRDIDFTKK